jgi:hypothetical protein
LPEISVRLHPLFAEAAVKSENKGISRPVGNSEEVRLLKMLRINFPATAGEAKKRETAGNFGKRA